MGAWHLQCNACVTLTTLKRASIPTFMNCVIDGKEMWGGRAISKNVRVERRGCVRKAIAKRLFCLVHLKIRRQVHSIHNESVQGEHRQHVRLIML